MNKEGNHLLRLFSHCPKCGAKAFVEDTEKSKRCEACDFVYYMNPQSVEVKSPRKALSTFPEASATAMKLAKKASREKS